MEREGGKEQPAPSDLSPRSLLPTQPCAPWGGSGWEGCPRRSRGVGEGVKLPTWVWASPQEAFREIRVVQATPLNIS